MIKQQGTYTGRDITKEMVELEIDQQEHDQDYQQFIVELFVNSDDIKQLPAEWMGYPVSEFVEYYERDTNVNLIEVARPIQQPAITPAALNLSGKIDTALRDFERNYWLTHLDISDGGEELQERMGEYNRTR